ncbi:hypothetical protein BVC80_8713g10 [Macleaya cordata]|uniref:Uncharacterized protein n=1 Tax=Macleaya cordata TaxID=56857 RepID=A0A200QA95_MACCD|nr:hypothetical protein BVC80_8713g10 [Macleaya cordata]
MGHSTRQPLEALMRYNSPYHYQPLIPLLLQLFSAQKKREKEERQRMGALTSAVIAIVALALGWITIEIACKPCLDKGREAIDRSLDPNYDPDDDAINIAADNNASSIRTPLNPDQHSSSAAAAPSTA